MNKDKPSYNYKKYLDENYLPNQRKKILNTFSILTIIGNVTPLAVNFLNNDGSINIGRISGSLGIVFIAILAIILIRYNRVELAGIFYCTIGLLSVTFGVYNGGLSSNIPILYFVIIVVAGAIISPIAVFIVGIASSLAYLVVAIYLLSQVQNPAPSYGISIALVSSILILGSAVLYIFSFTLDRIATSARHQANELKDANERLLEQRKLEIETSLQINVLSEALAELFKRQNTATEEQVLLVNEVASTSNELDAAARRIANNALSVSVIAEKALKSAQTGQEAAQDGVTAIATLRNNVENITYSVRYLNTQIERIGEVTDIIGEVADETNLLSLNATIEAAGAGEYGKRFAAVADEIQRLSRRTTIAVEQIQEVVTEIIQASEKSLQTTEDGLRQAQQGESLVVRLIDANNNIITIVNQTAELATNIANSTYEQRNASGVIVESVQRISIASKELASFTTQVSEVIHKLEKNAALLIIQSQPEKQQANNQEKILFSELFADDAELEEFEQAGLSLR
ncbi:methyl-accepting chemotaxis protein [Candidatus Chlorohelix sp.]|uniref:methyl-accepting chemotaxis protein n=1 Tax=Candidatus Chlorohelix sp. TaxID=3139201 RepID=UPI0030222C0A